MKQMRKKHSPEFKAKVALEAIEGLKTTAELAAQYQLHPVQIHQWKKALLDGAATVFQTGQKASKDKQAEVLTDQLYRQIGQLTVERDFLSRKLGK
jgi:transposase